MPIPVSGGPPADNARAAIGAAFASSSWGRETSTTTLNGRTFEVVSDGEQRLWVVGMLWQQLQKVDGRHPPAPCSCCLLLFAAAMSALTSC